MASSVTSAKRETLSGAPVRLGTTLSIKGSISADTDLYFDGELEGTLEAEKCEVVIGPNAKVIGDVKALKVIVVGSVKGDVTAGDLVELQESAKLEGNVSTSRVSIEDGSFFKGSIEITQGSRSKNS